MEFWRGSMGSLASICCSMVEISSDDKSCVSMTPAIAQHLNITITKWWWIHHNLGKPIKNGLKVLTLSWGGFTDRRTRQKCHGKHFFFRIYTSPDMAYRVTPCGQFTFAVTMALCLDRRRGQYIFIQSIQRQKRSTHTWLEILRELALCLVQIVKIWRRSFRVCSVTQLLVQSSVSKDNERLLPESSLARSSLHTTCVTCRSVGSATRWKEQWDQVKTWSVLWPLASVQPAEIHPINENKCPTSTLTLGTQPKIMRRLEIASTGSTLTF